MPTNHSKFILSPIIKNLSDAINASRALVDGINTYPLYEYIMQSTFLKMTGAQEQKLKCICWDIATNDYEYRYEKFRNGLGECSHYMDKKCIFDDLIGRIRKFDPNVDILSLLDKNNVISFTKTDILNIFENTIFVNCKKRDFIFFNNDNYINSSACFNLNPKNNQITFFESGLKDLYDLVVYKHRNRCAHNTLSYQENLPTLRELSDQWFRYQNYFFRFYFIHFLDTIYILLYKKYLQLLNECIC